MAFDPVAQGIAARAQAIAKEARLGVAPVNDRILVYGPSHAANHFLTTVPSGQPATPNTSIIGPVNWALFLSGGRARMEVADNIGGINGDRTIADAGYPGMLSRLDAVIATGVGHIVMCAPTANDRNSLTAAQSIAALSTMIDKILAAGILLTILPDYPHGSAAVTAMRLVNTSAQPQIDYWVVVNRWLLRQNGRRGLRVFDTAQILIDVTSGFGQAAAGLLYDGLHLSSLGAFCIGRALERYFRSLYPPVTGLPFGSTEQAYQSGVNPQVTISKQPYFGGTAGTLGSGATGVIANEWTTALGDGVTGAYSKVSTTGFSGRLYAEHGDGPISKDWQQIVLGGNATASNELAILRQSVTCSIGDLLRACAEIEVDANAAGIAGVSIYIFHNTSGQQIRAFQIPTVTATTLWPSAPLAGVLRTPRWTADSGTFLLQLAVRPISGAAVNATIRTRGLAAIRG